MGKELRIRTVEVRHSDKILVLQLELPDDLKYEILTRARESNVPISRLIRVSIVEAAGGGA